MPPEDPRAALRARLAAAAAQVEARREGRAVARPTPAAPPAPEPEPEPADAAFAPEVEEALPPATKAAAKRAPAKRPAAKSPAAKRPAAKRPAVSRARPIPLDVPEPDGVEEAAPGVAPPKKAAARKAAAKKAPAKKATAKKVPATKAPAKRAPAVKRPAFSRLAPEPLDVPTPEDDEVAEPATQETQEAPGWEPAIVAPAPAPQEPPSWQAAATSAPSPPPPVSTAPPTKTFTQPPSEPKRGAAKSIAIIVGVAVLVGLVVVGIVVGVSSLLGEDGVKYTDLKAGDCFKRPSGRFKNVTTVACDKSHDLEVYAVLNHPAGPKDAFPGMDELVRYASPLCLAQFQAYAGVPFDQLNLQDEYITPRESAWKDGSRRLVCAAGAQNDQPTTKSIKAG